MSSYRFPELAPIAPAPPRTVYLVASGDLRPSANVKCWPVQQQLEADVTRAVESLGWTVVRGHPFDDGAGHGFIDSQRKGHRRSSATLPPDAPLLVVEAVWQYSHHVLAGLRTHRGPIMVVANWNGTFPGLVGLLNLDRQPDQGRRGLLDRCGASTSPTSGRVEGCAPGLTPAGWRTRLDHVHPLPVARRPMRRRSRLGRALADQLRRDKAIIGVFDEGCMGMYNAIFDDELLNPLGIYKERLSQSALVAEMGRVRRRRGGRGDDVAGRCRAAVRLRHRRGHRADARAQVHQPTARCTSPRCASPTTSASTRSASSTSRASRTSSRRAIWPRGCSTTSNARRCAAATARASSTPARRCHTSTRSTRASPSMPSSPTASGRRWASTRRPRCTTCAGASSTAASSSGCS